MRVDIAGQTRTSTSIPQALGGSITGLKLNSSSVQDSQVDRSSGM
jgi:hypothetical protein